jgi:TonB family protein
MLFDFWRVWLPCSLVLHLLLLPVLAHVRLAPMGLPPAETLIILPITSVPTPQPAAPQPTLRPRAVTRPPLAVKARTVTPRRMPRTSTPPRAVEATLAVKAQATSDFSGLRHGMGGGRLPGTPGSIQHGTPLAPNTGGGPRTRMAAPRTGPMSAYGVPGGLDRDIAELPNAGPATLTGSHGSWAAAPGATDGTGRAPAGLSKGGPGGIAYLPEGGQTTYIGRGGVKGPIASAPTSARADALLAGGADGPIRPGGGGGLDRDVHGLPGAGLMTAKQGDWSVRPGDADGSGRAPTGIAKHGPSLGDGGGDGGTIIAAGRNTGPGPGGLGGGAARFGIAGTDDRIGPGTGRGGLERDVRGLPGSGQGSAGGHGNWGDATGAPAGGGPGDGTGPGRGGPSYGASFGDGITVGYPTLAAMEGLEGTVIVAVVVDADGRVTKAEVITRSPYDSLDNAAVRASRIWPFRPAVKNGEPAAGSAKLKFKFADGKVVVTQL